MVSIKHVGKLTKVLVLAIPALLIVFMVDYSKVQKQGDVLSISDFLPESTKQEPCTITDSIDYYTYTGGSGDNNKFGIYVYAEEEELFDAADELVNSNGGDWGYVLIPYNIRDRDYSKWAKVFEMLREKQLIPVVQLWAVEFDNYEDRTEDAAEFLNSFLWPVKQRYISVYNEPNDSKFWFGKADPENYARVLSFTIDTFKDENNDFFMLNGGLNASAPNGNGYIAPATFLLKMDQAVPGIFNKLDGWASHPYPQPNFSGSPYDKGWWSIRAYQEELNYIKNILGVKKSLPVFITETGWAHAEGDSYNSSYIPAAQVSRYLETAFKEVWLPDERVKAVMPFTIRYDAPFDHFSWIRDDDSRYIHFEHVKNLPKKAGNPARLEKRQLEPLKCQ